MVLVHRESCDGLGSADDHEGVSIAEDHIGGFCGYKDRLRTH